MLLKPAPGPRRRRWLRFAPAVRVDDWVDDGVDDWVEVTGNLRDRRGQETFTGRVGRRSWRAGRAGNVQAARLAQTVQAGTVAA